jgi:hypothetical protein
LNEAIVSFGQGGVGVKDDGDELEVDGSWGIKMPRIHARAARLPELQGYLS